MLSFSFKRCGGRIGWLTYYLLLLRPGRHSPPLPSSGISQAPCWVGAGMPAVQCRGWGLLPPPGRWGRNSPERILREWRNALGMLKGTNGIK